MFAAAILSLVALNAAEPKGVEQKDVKTVERPAARLTSATLPDHLKKLGYKVEVQNTEIGNALCVVSLEKNGWEFDIEATVAEGGALWLTASLVHLPAARLTSPKFLQLLEANALIGPCSFLYRAGDSSICIRLFVNDPSERGLGESLDLLTDKIRQTFPIWGQGAW